jgi:hypothetical protein
VVEGSCEHGDVPSSSINCFGMSELLQAGIFSRRDQFHIVSYL